MPAYFAHSAHFVSTDKKTERRDPLLHMCVRDNYDYEGGVCGKDHHSYMYNCVAFPWFVFRIDLYLIIIVLPDDKV